MTIQNEQRVKQTELGKLVELAENYLVADVLEAAGKLIEISKKLLEN